MRKYTKPDAHGYLMEAKACEHVCKELRRLIEKYQRAVNKETASRQAEFEMAMQYHSEVEIQDDYGYDLITEQQYDRLLDLFRNGKDALENHAPTVKELALNILYRIERDINEDQREWEFSALTPEQQRAERERAERAQKEWKEKVAELRRQRNIGIGDERNGQ
ncbi:MAG: adenylosuccinate lyase [Oscillospiraceae bacterium]|nr:adenylosuccinate lyase [Oscillospiraceae bacterium]